MGVRCQRSRTNADNRIRKTHIYLWTRKYWFHHSLRENVAHFLHFVLSPFLN